MNLADKANGEVLLLINDDVLLDANSIDAALNCLVITPTRDWSGPASGTARDV